MATSLPFQLRCTLLGHSMDVRCVAVGSDTSDFIVTGSRDRTAKVWRPSMDGVGYVESVTLRGHTNFVSCMCVVAPSDEHPGGLVLTGSNDKMICAFAPDNANPIYRLTGHTNTVCALAAGKFGTVVSGSWDETARVWLGQKCMMTLQGHTATVWAVAVMTQQGVVLTASADKTIKSWKAGQCERTFTGHTDCVRALAVISNLEFLSAANDGTVRRWAVTGEPVATVQAHDCYIYSVALLPEGGGFITAGEDRSVRVWKDSGECEQVIRLPAQSVWAVSVLPNGDIVAGASDAVARVFSCVAERQGSPETLAAFGEEVSGTALSSGELGSIKINELPGREALYEPGKRDGQTKLVRDGSVVGVYQWSGSESRWLKIGDAMGAAGTQAPGTKVHYEGKEYDFVFNVDIEEGRPALKLPYNVTEDPWFAAQKFLDQNDISQMFLDQVANFIMKNTKGITLGSQPTASYNDPFTGQSRYMPNSVNGTANVAGTDPFTGAGRYVPSEEQTVPAKANNPGLVPSNQYFPQQALLTFDSGNLTAIAGKLKEFSAQHKYADGPINGGDIDEAIRLADVGSQCGQRALNTLERLLRSSKDIVFPALDVLRLAIRNPAVCKHFCSDGTRFLQLVLDHLSSSSPPSNQMLMLRTVCNAMGDAAGERVAMENRGAILEAALQLLPSGNKNVQVALATLLLDYTILLNRRNDLEAKVQFLSSVASLHDSFDDAEALFRLMVAIGTFAASDDESLALVKSMDLLQFVGKLKSVGSPTKVAECARYLETVLS